MYGTTGLRARGEVLATYGQVVGKWLRDAMARSGRTNKRALEAKSGVTRSFIYDILSGEGNPSPDTVAKLAAALGVDGPDFALGSLQEPSDVSGWVGQAQLALDKAQRLLRPTAPPEDDEPGRTAKRTGRPGGPPKRGRGVA
jgi:transcriptional regulator with XRE-family HTH domain